MKDLTDFESKGGATLRALIFCNFMAKYYGNSTGVVLSKIAETDSAEICLAAAARQMSEGRFLRRAESRSSVEIYGAKTKRE